MRRFTPGGRGAFRRRFLSRRDISADRFSPAIRATAADNRSRASFRFCACERESWTVTEIPLGRCRSVTAVDTLLTFWPPGPEERANVSSRSASRSSGGFFSGAIVPAILARVVMFRSGTFPARSEGGAPSRLAPSGIHPLAVQNFGRAGFRLHRKSCARFRNSRP